MVYCFDLDDTICVHSDRDYLNAIPIAPMIARIRSLRDADKHSKIIIHTSRGMNSCKSDVVLADLKNRKMVETWLQANGVPYDEIVFGKPLADVYIDDKGVSAETFMNGEVQALQGFSGASVIRVADLVVKEGDKIRFEYDWYKDDAKQCFKSHKVPKVYSMTLGKKLCLQFINGETMANILSNSTTTTAEIYISAVVEIIKEFSSKKFTAENKISDYCSFVGDRASNVGVDASQINELLMGCEDLREATFCHGDMTMDNIIVDGNNQLFLIDPSVSPISSWLLDAAKIRASLNGLSSALNGDVSDLRKYLHIFDSHFGDSLGAIKTLEKTHYIRVMYYAKSLGRIDVFSRLKRLFEI